MSGTEPRVMGCQIKSTDVNGKEKETTALL